MSDLEPGIDTEGEITSARVRKIPGRPLDPPPRIFDATVQKLDDRHAAAGVGFRAWHRFVHARTPLLTAGTTYYLFLSLISVAAFAYGVVALLGADQFAAWLTVSLENAFPGLIGQEGISPEDIRGYGTTASIAGLVVMGFAGTSSVNAAYASLHVIYGAPKDPRNIVVRRSKMFGHLMILGPLVLLSFVPSLLVSTLAEPILDWLNIDTGSPRTGLVFLSVLVGILLNYSVLHVLLSRLGGIRPPERALRIGAITGAVVMEAMKYAMASIIAWSVGKPEYGAFAVPITFMLVLYLLSMTAYGSACLTAAIALKEADDLRDAAGFAGADPGNPLR